MIFYFSGHQGIAYFAKQIASRRGESSFVLPESEERADLSLPQDEPAVIVLSARGKRLSDVVEDVFKRIRLARGQEIYFTLLGSVASYSPGKLLADYCRHRNLNFKGVEMVRMPAVA